VPGRQAAGRTSLIGQLFSQAQDVVTVRELLRPGWWSTHRGLIALLAIALVPAFVGEAHFNAQSYALNYAARGAARARYVRQTGASAETAKEVKIFGLNAFLIERYRTLATSFFEANRRIALATRKLGKPALRDRDRCLLCRVRLHRMAHGPP